MSSVHLAEFPKEAPASERQEADAKLLSDWERIFAIRDEVLKALEEARIAKQIGSSLEAKVILTTDAGTTRFLLDYFDQLRYIFIVSQVEVHEGDAGNAGTPVRTSVKIEKADGQKCERCWNYSTRVGEFESYPTVCERCIAALMEIERAATA